MNTFLVIEVTTLFVTIGHNDEVIHGSLLIKPESLAINL